MFNFKKVATASVESSPVDMKKVKMKSWLPARSASQIYSAGIEFALANKDKEQCTYFMFCKDFLQDAIHGSLNNRAASIYGFTYDPKSMPAITLDKTRIALVNQSDRNFLKKAENVEDFINQFNKRFKMKRTRLYQVSNPPKRYSNGVLFTSGSGIWQNSPPLISLYSLLLRTGFSHTKGNDCMDTVNKLISGKIGSYCPNDMNYLRQSKAGIDKMLKLGYRKFFFIDSHKNYPASVNVNSMHGMGIVSFASGYSIVPYWKRKSIDKPKTPDVKAE